MVVERGAAGEAASFAHGAPRCYDSIEPMNRHILARWCLVLALTLGVTACGDSGPRPHVILVTLDTVRADYFGCLGRPGDVTPHFDALAAEGALFELAVSSSAVTPVSHASILTGQYQQNHGLRVLMGTGGFRLDESVPTLTTRLKNSGYRTAAVHSAFPVSKFFGFHHGFDHFDSVDSARVGDGWDTHSAQRRSDDTTERVLALLEKTKDPLFIWIHYWDPHDAILVPPDEYLPPNTPRNEDGRVLPSGELYEAELRYTDKQFGRLVASLKERGIYDDTLFVVVSDHGEGLEDGLERHGWYYHRILYQEQIHIPLIVKPPTALTTKPGVRVPELVRTVDIYPTVLDYLGLEHRPIDGRSLRPLIEGLPDRPRTAYADQINLWDQNAGMLVRRPQAAFLHVAMEGTWKLIYRPTDPESSELYDVGKDPLEMNNLFDTEREQVHRLARQLVDHRGWVRDPLPPDESASPAEQADAMKALEGLGYLGTDGAIESRPELWKWYDAVSREIHPESRAELRERQDAPPIWLPVYTGPVPANK